MELKKLKISDVEVNNGQIKGLPANPRQWTQGEFSKLRKSLKETPELFEARGIIVYPINGKYIALGGNMRLEAARANKAKEVPCIVLPTNLTTEKLKEIVIKDNGSFGEWDVDGLANEWDDLPLEEWGYSLGSFSINEEIEESKEQKEENNVVKMTFKFTPTQAEVIEQAIAEALQTKGENDREMAVYLIFKDWQRLAKRLSGNQ